MSDRRRCLARSDFISGTGWVLVIDFTTEGSNAFDALAAAQFHKQIALEVNGTVVSAPVIQPGEASFRSFGGTVVINQGGTRGFTQNEVRDLAQ
jgi:preprotein translocase subunit SecD